MRLFLYIIIIIKAALELESDANLSKSTSIHISQIETSTENDENENPNPFKRPNDLFNIFIWLTLIPIKALFYITIPDCKREKFGKFPYYLIAFMISTVYVGIFTYGVVWMVVIICKFFNKNDLKFKFSIFNFLKLIT